MGNKGEVCMLFVLIGTLIFGVGVAIREDEHKKEIHNIQKHKSSVIEQQKLIDAYEQSRRNTI